MAAREQHTDDEFKVWGRKGPKLQDEVTEELRRRGIDSAERPSLTRLLQETSASGAGDVADSETEADPGAFVRGGAGRAAKKRSKPVSQWPSGAGAPAQTAAPEEMAPADQKGTRSGMPLHRFSQLMDIYSPKSAKRSLAQAAVPFFNAATSYTVKAPGQDRPTFRRDPVDTVKDHLKDFAKGYKKAATTEKLYYANKLHSRKDAREGKPLHELQGSFGPAYSRLDKHGMISTLEDIQHSKFIERALHGFAKSVLDQSRMAETEKLALTDTDVTAIIQDVAETFEGNGSTQDKVKIKVSQGSDFGLSVPKEVTGPVGATAGIGRKGKEQTALEIGRKSDGTYRVTLQVQDQWDAGVRGRVKPAPGPVGPSIGLQGGVAKNQVKEWESPALDLEGVGKMVGKILQGEATAKDFKSFKTNSAFGMKFAARAAVLASEKFTGDTEHGAQGGTSATISTGVIGKKTRTEVNVGKFVETGGAEGRKKAKSGTLGDAPRLSASPLSASARLDMGTDDVTRDASAGAGVGDVRDRRKLKQYDEVQSLSPLEGQKFELEMPLSKRQKDLKSLAGLPFNGDEVQQIFGKKAGQYIIDRARDALAAQGRGAAHDQVSRVVLEYKLRPDAKAFAERIAQEDNPSADQNSIEQIAQDHLKEFLKDPVHYKDLLKFTIHAKTAIPVASKISAGVGGLAKTTHETGFSIERKIKLASDLDASDGQHIKRLVQRGFAETEDGAERPSVKDVLSKRDLLAGSIDYTADDVAAMTPPKTANS
ncbi:hypothetical protein [Leisingera sp. S232]|uniref:hypothetical protein n=1 Tax=Leisingera sp. S232 TaxID=3415132 RepID=UPI003C7D89DF